MTTDSTHDRSTAALGTFKEPTQTGLPDDLAADIEERVLKVIATTKRLPRESVTLASSFETLGIDSLDRLNILFDLESEFDIQINDEDAKRVENIGQMVAGVAHLVVAKSGITTPNPLASTSVISGGTTPLVDSPELEAEAAIDPAPMTKPASSIE